MQKAFRSLGPLLDFLDLDPRRAPESLDPDPAFPLLVPRDFAGRMRKGDWRDPLLLQVLPLRREARPEPGFCADAVGDLAAQAAPGLLHKYPGRALLMASPHCAVHCRYCFRREFPYRDIPHARWEEAWAYLERHPEIEELILSGGDPLSLDDRRLRDIFARALAISSLRTLRIHTRLPVVLPARVDAGILALFSGLASRKSLILVVHVNHPAELLGGSAQALLSLRTTGALLLNQSVLLKGVNDDARVLGDLSKSLIALGVLPYYLHQLDRVMGTAHFEVAKRRGLEIVAEMRGNLPGYAVPRYVEEVAGEPSKLPVEPIRPA